MQTGVLMFAAAAFVLSRSGKAQPAPERTGRT